MKETQPTSPSIDRYSNSSAHLRLAGTIRMYDLCRDVIPDDKRCLLTAAIVDDARTLMGYILPQEQRKLFRAHEQDIPQTEEPYSPPSLRDLHLLIEAYDATGDLTLRDALEHILDTSAPHYADQLAEAYDLSQAKGTSVKTAYTAIITQIDDALDQTSYLAATGGDREEQPSAAKSAPEKPLESTQPHMAYTN